MNWITFGVVFILAQPSRHKLTELFDNAFGAGGGLVGASPVPPNGKFVRFRFVVSLNF